MSDDFDKYIIETIDRQIENNKEYCNRINDRVNSIVSRIEDDTITLTYNDGSDHDDNYFMVYDFPADIPIASYPSSNIIFEGIGVVGSLGEYTADTFRDLKTSEAYNMGFVTALRMIEKGLFPVKEETE